MPEKSKTAKAGAKSSAKLSPKLSPKPAAKSPEKAAAPAPTVKLTKGDTGGNKAIVTRKMRPTAPVASEHKPAAKTKAKALPVLPSSERAALVAREAYFMAERRGFSVGNDLADWLEAERIVDESYQFT